jgi:mRNA interferase HigB
MNVIAVKTLRAFWSRHPDAEQPLKTWHALVRKSEWATPSEAVRAFPKASLLRNQRICFNIGGNKYRLITKVEYAFGIVFILWIGTHAEYDRIDANTIEYHGHD